MPFQPSIPDEVSLEESEALARFVHDLKSRMEHVADLLSERGTPTTAILAGSIARDLRVLEDQLLRGARQMTPDTLPAYSSSSAQ
jgi:hypothetical protein